MMRLGKLEKRVLATLSKKRQGDKYIKYPEGNNMNGLARRIYGLKAFEHGGLKNNYSSSLSQVLNRLWKKKLVLKCKPMLKTEWKKADPYGWPSEGFMSRQVCDLKVLDPEKVLPRVTGTGAKPAVKETIRFKRKSCGVYDKTLPSNTKVWWMLSQQGKKKVEELVNQEKVPDLNE